jgi:hypothetical protein
VIAFDQPSGHWRPYGVNRIDPTHADLTRSAVSPAALAAVMAPLTRERPDVAWVVELTGLAVNRHGAAPVGPAVPLLGTPGALQTELARTALEIGSRSLVLVLPAQAIAAEARVALAMEHARQGTLVLSLFDVLLRDVLVIDARGETVSARVEARRRGATLAEQFPAAEAAIMIPATDLATPYAALLAPPAP